MTKKKKPVRKQNPRIFEEKPPEVTIIPGPAKDRKPLEDGEESTEDTP